MSDVLITMIPGPKLGEDWQQYVKLPIPIRAKQMDATFECSTLEGVMTGQPGDYCIIGITGEVYPCAKSIFDASYARMAVSVACEAEG